MNWYEMDWPNGRKIQMRCKDYIWQWHDAGKEKWREIDTFPEEVFESRGPFDSLEDAMNSYKPPKRHELSWSVFIDTELTLNIASYVNFNPGETLAYYDELSFGGIWWVWDESTQHYEYLNGRPETGLTKTDLGLA